MNPRLAASVSAGKAVAAVSRWLGRGGGTALPGVVAERIDPRFVQHLGRRLERGRVLVTGTNGKTTTTRMLASILDAAAIPHLHNREGSNMMRGIGSALIAAASPGGAIRGGAGTLGLFEVDEATLPGASAALAPTILTFTNLFRDQLDRYGEVDTVAALWREALAVCPRDATLVLNADDPSVAELALEWPGPIHWFGLDDAAFATDLPGAFDARWCRACGGTFAYERQYFAHVGWWRCTGCDRRRPEAETSGTDVCLELERADFRVAGLGNVSMPLTGVYNVYNALAAIATARVLRVQERAIIAGLANVTAAFGRQEMVELDGRRLRLMLCKNPAGANQVLRLLDAITPTGAALKVGVLLNDRFADGQDVSWTWDVDYESLATKVSYCWAGGDRAEDMALRLKYARWPVPSATIGEPATFVDAVLSATSPGDDVFLVPTYTAMLDLRTELERRGAAARFWQR